MEHSGILEQDLVYVWNTLTDSEKSALNGSTVLITGCGGFLGQFHLSFYEKYANKLQLKKVIGIDNFMLGKSPLIKKLSGNPLFDIYEMDVADFNDQHLGDKYSVDYIIHMASIASPTYYRLHPLETVDSNIRGLRTLLETFSPKKIKGFLFYSSSEIYGDPDNAMVPTPETYWGTVSCVGPRACYDESKRFGETLCYIYNKLYNIPISIVRLFNVYGPGLKLNDRRAPADFANAILRNEDISIFSNGQPTRTFCYVADSFIGELKAMLYGKFEVFNIGISEPEISIREFAELFKEVGEEMLHYSGKIQFKTSDDKEYLTHDPERRSPDITKAKTLLHFYPQIDVHVGVSRYLRYLREEEGNVVW